MTDPERIVRVPQHCRSAHGVFTAEPLPGGTDFPAPADVLLRRFGATDDDLARLAARPHVRMFLTEVAPDVAAESALAARRDAVDLGAAHDGVVLDLVLPRLVAAPAGRAAAEWVAVDVDATGLTTRGLEVFGLPDLRLDGVERDDTAAAIAVLLGVAQRLITEWPANDPVGPAVVTLHDVALAYGDQVDRAEPDRSTDLLIALRDGELVLTLLGHPGADLFG